MRTATSTRLSFVRGAKKNTERIQSSKKVSTSLQRNDYPLTPLQAGDFLAYEIGKLYSTLDPDRDKLFEKFRGSFQLVSSITAKWGDLSAHNIKVGSSELEIPKRRKAQ